MAIGSLASFGLTSGGYFAPGRAVDYTVADFESQDFFNFDRIDQPWEITSEGAIGADSQYGLVGDAVSAGTGGLIVSKPSSGVASDGPPAYPQIGDTVEFDWQITAGNRFYLFVGGQDTSYSDRYEIPVELDRGRQSVIADFDGGGLLGESEGNTLAQDVEYTTTVHWQDDRSFDIETREYRTDSRVLSFTTSSDRATDVTTGRFGAYVQSSPATEVHIDDIRLSRPIGRTTLDAFEGGVSPRWHVNDFGHATDRAYTGSGSGRLATAQQDRHQAARTFDIARRPQSVRLYMQETEDSFGEGLRLRNSNGAIEGGIAIDNPEWDVDDATGIGQVYDPQDDPAATGDGYDRWVELTLLFDWHAGTFDARFRSFVGGSVEVRYTASDRPLRQEVDIASLELWDYQNGNWGDGRSIDAWTDDLSRETGQRTGRTVPTNLSVTNRESDSLTLDWQGVGPAFDVYRSGSSGTTASDYQLLTTVQRYDAPPITDSGLNADTDYYYRVGTASRGTDRLSTELQARTSQSFLVAENFEDGDYDGWNPQPDQWGVEQTQYAKYGDFALHFVGRSASGGTAGKESFRYTGIDGLPSQGDDITFNWTIHDNTEEYQFGFCKQDDGTEQNYNYIEYDGVENELNIGTDAGPKYIDDRISGVTLSEDAILEPVIHHYGSYFTVDFPGFRTLDTRNRAESDTIFDSGGIGLDVDPGGDGHLGRVTYESR